MANPEHLRILKQGVEAWNKWREEANEDILPDLSGADLKESDLSAGEFPFVDLNHANLTKANLYKANLISANLRGANLAGVNLTRADLGEADLNEADLSKSNLEAADLYDADLSNSNLQGARLNGACLEEAKLCGANLRDAKLFEANLAFTDLTKGDLTRAYLRMADSLMTNFENANMRDADLTFCNLVGSNFTHATLTGAKLYGTAKDDWIIRDVKCEYVYWDEKGENRSPKDRDLEPGEFERLYAALPTIEYVFEHGMEPLDPLIMDRVVQAIREKRPEFDIKVDSINARGLAPSIKFTVQQEEHKEPALQEVHKAYDERIRRLETEKERLYELLGQAIDKAGDVKLITAGPGAIVATDGSTVNIQQHIHNALELQKAIAKEPEESESFAKVAKKTALNIIGGAIKDIAKGQVKEAAKQIIELGIDLGPLLVRMAPAAYAFFKSIGA